MISLNNSVILITGAAGFIGSYLCKRLVNDYPNTKIVGVDNLNDYYDVNLKYHRLSWFKDCSAFEFLKGDIADKEFVNNVFATYKPSIVVNLAAQAGVRYSITNPDA